jgi:translation elongation factor EF-Ts
MVTKGGRGYTVSTSGKKTNLSQSIKKHLLTLIKESLDNNPVNKQTIERADEILRTQGRPKDITEEIINLLGNLGVTAEAMRYIRPEIENTGGYARYANLFVI